MSNVKDEHKDGIVLDSEQERALTAAGHNQHAAPVVQRQPMTAMDMIADAVQRGASIEQIDRLIQLKERMEAEEARRAFVAAKVAFKAEGIVVVRDKFNNQFNSQYASLGQLVNTVAPVLGKHQLSADWEIDQSNGIEVTCILSHAMGHRERVKLKVPADTSGAKNALQQIKSSITYARSATFESACGLASTDANLDDDGNSSGHPTKDERQEMRGAAREMRQRATPADVANRGKSAPATDSPEFLALRQSARMAADKGRDSFGEFWKVLSGAKRNMLAPELEDLQQRVEKAEKNKAGE